MEGKSLSLSEAKEWKEVREGCFLSHRHQVKLLNVVNANMTTNYWINRISLIIKGAHGRVPLQLLLGIGVHVGGFKGREFFPILMNGGKIFHNVKLI